MNDQETKHTLAEPQSSDQHKTLLADWIDMRLESEIP